LLFADFCVGGVSRRQKNYFVISMGRNTRSILQDDGAPDFCVDFVVCGFVVTRQRSGQKKIFVKFFNRNQPHILADDRSPDLCRIFVISGFVVTGTPARQNGIVC
jgi:hypothetical protein